MAIASPSATLEAELNLLTAMVDLLKQEQQLLINANSDLLQMLTPQKATAVNQLATLANERHQHLGAAGFAAGEEGMQEWMGKKADAGARALWQRLLDETREAKELNRLNGMLINRQLNQTQTIINAMRTPAASPDMGVYGPTGQASTGGPSRRFVIG